MDIDSTYTAREVSFPLFNGLPNDIGFGNGSETYTVTAYDNGTLIATQTLSLLSYGTAASTTPNPAAYGVVNLTAPAGNVITRVEITPSLRYGNGVWNYSIDSIALNQTLQQVFSPTETTLTLDPDPVDSGETVTASVTVAPTPTAAGASTPSGTVSVAEGATTLCTVTLDASGAGTCTFAAGAGGAHTMTARYPGDTELGASSGTDTLTVNAIATTTTLTIPPGATRINDVVTLSVTVTAATGTAIPAGIVAISDGTAPVCTFTLSATGTGQCNLTAATTGIHPLTATYAGNQNFAGSSATLNLNVLALGIDGPAAVPALDTLALIALALMLLGAAALGRQRGLM
jgi:hypothetical protein